MYSHFIQLVHSLMIEKTRNSSSLFVLKLNTVKTSTILIHLIYLYYQWRQTEQFVTLMTVKTCSYFMHWVALKILFFMLWLSLFRCVRDGVVMSVSLCFIVEIHCCLCDSLFKSFFSCSSGLCSLNFRLFSLVFESVIFFLECF
jgi:hypothetical protein